MADVQVQSTRAWQFSEYSNTAEPVPDALPQPTPLSHYVARVALIGDSITELGYDPYTVSGKPSMHITHRAIVDQANALLGQRMEIVARAGKSGERLDQMLKRFDTQVAIYKPNLVILQGGSNDIDQGYSADQSWASMLAMYMRCQEIGATLLYIGTSAMSRAGNATVPSPIDGVTYNESQEFAKLCAYARRASRMLPNFLHYDMAQVLREYTDRQQAAFGAIKTPTIIGSMPAYDGTHPTPYMCYAQAVGLAGYLDKILAPIPPDVPVLNRWGSDGDPNMIAGNHMLIGTGGTVSAPNTGTLPFPLNITSSGPIAALCSSIARPDGGYGKYVQLDISGATALTDYLRVFASGTYTKALGIPSFFQAYAKVIAATTGSIFKLVGNLQFLDSNFALIAQVSYGGPHTMSSAYANDGFAGHTGPQDFGLQSTPKMRVPAGTAKYVYELRIYTTVGAQLSLVLGQVDGVVDPMYDAILASLKRLP